MNSVNVGHSYSQDGGDGLHVLVHGLADLYESVSNGKMALTLSGKDGGDSLHVIAVGYAGLADDPVLEDRLQVVQG